MKRFKSLFTEAKVEVDDISVGKKKKKPAGVKADEPLKGYAYNEDEQEEKYFVVKVTGKGPRGSDHMNVKTKAHSQKAALEKIKKQYPNTSVSIVKEDFETQLSLAIEEIELDEALSPKEKEKRLLMIKKAVEKLNRANIEKVKKQAMRDMKASGMFDDVIDEETELDEALQHVHTIKITAEAPSSPKLSEVADIKNDFKLHVQAIRGAVKKLGGLITDTEVPSRQNKFVGKIKIGTRGDANKLSIPVIQRGVKSGGIELDKRQFVKENQYVGGYRDSSRDGLGPKAKANAPKLSRIEQLKKQLEFAYKQREVHDEAYRKYMEQAKAARERNPDDLGAIHGAEARADAQEEMAQKQSMKIQDLKDDIAALRDQMESVINELSPELLKRYRDKAVKQFKQSDKKRNDPGYTDAKRKEHDKRAIKRFKGSQSASQKIKDRGGYSEVPAGHVKMTNDKGTVRYIGPSDVKKYQELGWKRTR